MRMLPVISCFLIGFFFLFGKMANGQCAFNVSATNPCGNEAITFSVENPVDSVLYEWDFQADGTIDAAGDTLSFAFPGNELFVDYTVYLFADSTLCDSTVVTVQSAPDASIGDVGGDFVICSNVQQDATLEVFNASATIPINVSYEIDWGDNSPVETYDNTTFSPAIPITHVYSAFGYYTITVTVTSNGTVTCNTATSSYLFYYGSNPAVGLNTNGNTVGLCAPQTIDFPITNTALNSEGTEYEMFVNGELVDAFSHPPPGNFTFTFLETSCGITTIDGLYNNAFDVRIQATNPCASTSAVVEPIELSSPPIVVIESSQITPCPDEVITFSNASIGISEVNNGNCSGTAPVFWTITPDDGWTLVGGSLFNSETIDIVFDSIGVYTIELTVQSDACPPQTGTLTVTIADPPMAELDSIALSAAGNCVPSVLTFNNQSSGTEISYNWTVSPDSGWVFVNGTTADSLNPEITIIDPGTYTIQLGVTNFCGTDFWDTTLVFIDVPSIILDPIPDGCIDATLNFDPTNANIQDNGSPLDSIVWEFPGAMPPISNQLHPTGIFYDTAGVYTVTVTAYNACGSTTVTDEFAITTPGVLTIPDDFGSCLESQPFTLQATPSGGTWMGPGVDSLTGEFDPIVAGLGIHSIIYNFGFGACFVTDTLVVEVSANPPLSLPDSALCVNDPSVDLTTVGPPTGEWTSGSIGLVGNEFDPALAGIGNHVLFFTDTIANCFSAVDITVVPLPVVDAGPNMIFCDNDFSFSLGDGNPSGGTWSGQGVDPNTGTFNPADAGGTGFYYVFYGYADSLTQCVGEDSLLIHVTINESADAGEPETVCLNDDPFIPTPVTAGGSWSGTGIDSLGQFDPALAGVGTHILTYAQGIGPCETTDNKVITVLALPTLNPPDPVYCLNEEPINLVPYASSTGIFGSSTVNAVDGDFFIPDQAGVGTHFVFFTDTATTCYNLAELEVLDLPGVIAGNDTSYCINNFDTALPTGNPPGGTWTGIGVNSIDATFNATTAGGPGTYTAYYTIQDTASFCFNSDSITIEVTTTTFVEAGTDEIVCLNEIPFLPASVTTGGAWSGPGIDTSGWFNPVLAGIGLHEITYTVGEGICQGDDTKTIEVLPLPQFQLPGPTCLNADTINLATIAPGPGTWQGAALFQDTLIVPEQTGAGQLYLTFQDGQTGCSASDSLEILALTPILVNDTIYCDSPGSIELPFTDPLGGLWTGNGVSGTTFDPQGAGGVGSYVLTYSIIDGNNCPNADSITVQVVPPEVIEAGPVDTVCIDQGLYTLSEFLPLTGGYWTGTGVVDSSGVFDPELAGGGSHLLTYTFGVGNCQVVDTKVIFVVDLSFVEAGNPFEACVSDLPFNMTTGDPAGGVWSGSGITDPVTGLFDPGTAGVGTFDLIYLYTESFSGCTQADTLLATVHPLPVPAFTGPSVICVGDTAFFDNQSPDIVSAFWDFGDGNNANDSLGVHIYEMAGTYEVTLIVENSFNCLDSISQPILVTIPPVADFVLDTTETCFTGPITLTNLSSGYQPSYEWDLGNGQLFSGSDPGSVIYPEGMNDTLYYITLEATNICGTDIHTDTLLVHTSPEAVFSPNLDDGCSPLIVDFINLSSGTPTDFYWDFDNGSFSTDSVPAPVVFTTDTTTTFYEVSMVATNVCGADTAFHTIEVYPPQVEAFFFADTTSGCAPLTVNFTNFSAFESTVFWDFGDGTTSEEENPTHTFTEAGVYPVVQYVSNSCGTDSTIIPITVFGAPPASFEHAPTVCEGESVNFSNTTGGPVTSFWMFGDGNNSAQSSPTHVYQNAGTYTVVLTITDINTGCTSADSSNIEVLGNPAAAFTPSAQQGCIPLEVDFLNQTIDGAFYEWDFGDGNTSTEMEPSHTYFIAGTYTVTLIATDLNGCFADTSLMNVQAYPLPESAFSVDAEDLCGVPTTFTLTNESTGAAGFIWDFGNGQQSTLNNPEVTYSDAGDFTITLISSNAFNCYDTTAQVIRTYQQPIADFDLDPAIGCDPLTVLFDNLSQYADAAYWDFGDGNTSTELTPVHVYEEPGIYTVSLSVFNQGVCQDTFELANVVEVLPTPVANFTYQMVEDPQFAGYFQFNNFSQNANQYYWDFGDGDTSTVENPRHRYLTNGTHAVRLIAENIYGCSDTLIQILEPLIQTGLFIPNAFSPEIGVGDVRLFKPKGIGLREYQIEIFSPYGKLLWSSTALEDGAPAESWDGTSGGKQMPQDVYVWKASAVFEDGNPWLGMPDLNGNRHRIGTITLLR